MIPTMKPASSSMVQEYGYDADSKRLYVRFSNGKLYAYVGVPADTFAALDKAGSIGQFINASIKPHYAAEQIWGE